MSIKDFIRIILSRIVASVGMTLGTISMLYSLYCFFFSANPYRFILGGGSIVAIFIGYGLYKFALKHIYDEWDHYR